MKRFLGWPVWLLVLAVALAVMVQADRSRLAWASSLSAEGSPPPKRDAASPTGYTLGQRHFLGTRERGETYRWIAAAQDMIASGPFAASTYNADNVPLGRPQLLPRLFGGWLATISWALHAVTGEPLAISVEQAALWEPVVSHLLAFIAVAVFVGVRYGPAGAGVAGLFFLLFAPLAGQFLPGALTARTWAALLATYALALNLAPRRSGADPKPGPCTIRSAVASGIAIWLDPSLGFPAVLIAFAAAAVAIRMKAPRLPCLRWSIVGSAVIAAAWLIDRSPWSLAAGELRFVHPLYAAAWLGLGLGLDGWQNLRLGDRGRKWAVAEIVAALSLVSALAYVQLKHDYRGWLYWGAAMRRTTSLEETIVFNNVLDWFAGVSAAEALLVAVPLLAAVAAIVVSLRGQRSEKNGSRQNAAIAAVLLAGVVLLTAFAVRWFAFASLLSLVVVWHLAAPASEVYRRVFAAVAGAFLLGLLVWDKSPSGKTQRPWGGAEIGPADIEALVHRHFSHWMASHNPGQSVVALAPPELSDSLVFHGGCRVLMSTAWQSYSGQVAASRVLSALESTEAEAVLQSRTVTHIVLPSWDKVLPLFVQNPTGEGKMTLYARLQRWVFPAYLRPIPYRLPPIPGFAAQKLAVFKVTAPQDEALLLSRLAEYFVEMGLNEQAALATRVLTDSYADDPNAAVARAIVYAHSKQGADFEREVARLEDDIKAGRTPLLWDRRVQRAIVLALGRRNELARAEVDACLAQASEADLLELTPLQAYRLEALGKGYGIQFPDSRLADLAASIGSEYLRSQDKPAKR
ncbi:hypothetical protein DB347_07210 [Opitutaceae bacterium EW11]|nr:hypothetical protein DB347_07210 [Opitutaceae bacterium EW11]